MEGTTLNTKPTPPDWLFKILEKNSTERYKMEYRNDLSNHVALAIISLYHSGCEQERIENYVEWYVERLELTTEPDTTEDPLTLLGQHNLAHFNDLVSHYKKVLGDVGDLDNLVRQEFPKLTEGLSHAALHGLIELGYGLSVNSVRNICQGLAYLHYAYKQLGSVDAYEGPDLNSLGKGTKDIVSVLDEVRNDHLFQDAVLKDSTDPSHNYTRTSFQNRMSALMDHHIDVAMKYVHSIKFPEFWDPQSIDSKQVTQICNWLMDCCITAFVASERKNDFFLIHGVTGAWSLKQIMLVLHNQEDILKALRIFMCTVLGDYIAIKCPALNQAAEEPEKTISGTLSEALLVNNDEHMYKLIQVCAERSRDNPDNEQLYTTACNIAIKYPLAFP